MIAKKIFFLLALLLLTTSRVGADNLQVADVSISASEEKQMAVNLSNAVKSYVAFQLDLILPTGIAVSKDNNGKWDVSLNTERLSNHTLGVSAIGNNTYRILAYSLSNTSISGTTGSLLNIKLKADQTVSSGTYQGKITGQVFSDAALNQYRLNEIAFQIEVKGAGLPDEPELKVKLSKTTATIEKGKTLTLKATFTPSDFSDKSVTWKSSDTKVATVSSSGKVTGVKAGTATITCTSKATGAKATCKVTIGYVKLDKTTANIEKGKTLTLTATVYPSSLSDRSVTWASSDKSVATVSSSGKVTGVKAGTATITCTSKATGLKETCAVTVGYVKLDKTTANIEKGKTLTLKATVYPSDLKDKSVTWTTSDKKIATVSSSGKVTGVKAGTATITCTSKATGLKETCAVTVGYVSLDKTEVALEKGKTLTLKATVYPSSLKDKSVTWTTSDKKIATVSSSGKVKGVKAGTVTITCTSKATGLKETCKVTVGYVKLDKTEVRIKKGKTVTLKATVYPSSLSDKSVTWKSSNTKVATVTSAGKVKGIKAGTVTITCTSKATGLKETCKVTVSAVAGTRSMFDEDENEDEYDGTTGIEDLEERSAVEEGPYDVYDLSGRKVANQVTSLDGLPHGIYIVNGKKMLKR